RRWDGRRGAPAPRPLPGRGTGPALGRDLPGRLRADPGEPTGTRGPGSGTGSRAFRGGGGGGRSGPPGPADPAPDRGLAVVAVAGPAAPDAGAVRSRPD